ncbi:zinc-binding alcohol dehydrogenase family protein [Haliangium ochraceum]|uniref:Zinc-binding dehydrogenase n=1 Tax=Haliangium ochraceum (strain DSM 14365 / JCM 11303 / SMP-2) TaxID=502025 RepID=D0LPU5_HALO1|nr:zinc-binding alcohol dehydrogenase family protein [Haliangium ochraceum]ACY15458.1 conserved hypothetical protein [Haliangium ochraceum DSM 14365]
MKTITTEAWVLRPAEEGSKLGPLRLETFTLPPLAPEEVLVRPIFGCWEGNMDHAVRRSPVDLCSTREEPAVVIGNAGVVQVVEAGEKVTSVAAGDVCLLFCNGVWDAQGYPVRIFGYDAPGTVGVLAKTTKMHHRQLIRIPHDSPFSLRQWAAFSLRYITAWANWRVAYACWRSQMPEVPADEAFVCGWGGGVALAELSLARAEGFSVAMVTSKQARIELLHSMEIDAIDRSQWEDARFGTEFLKEVKQRSSGRGVSIFIDNLGISYKTTLRALARQGVITTSGWKHGMSLAHSRAMECIGRHIHVHTHYARYEEGEAAVRFANEHGWMAPVADQTFGWAEIPELADAYARGAIDTYFPIFAVNEDLMVLDTPQ